ncbi:hypothetical protein RRG08_042207 [Elysia crispata]|uniref:Uncharacterized protein n=1 Tax=Elysia crispata TaxID=231223 RepID=A0AAE1EGT8_9GAST|nr:hypothetical protein RRG08_042207 [Elysia crispata]
MLSYLQRANRSVHHVVLTPGEQHPVADSALLRAMKQVYDQNGEPKRHSLHGFLINTPLEDEELLTTPVLKWITPGDILKNMTFEGKSLIDKMKEFFNSNQVALWLHDTDVPDAKCHARKGPHFIVESTNPNSRNLKNFRALQTACSKYNCGMFVSKVTTTPDKGQATGLADALVTEEASKAVAAETFQEAFRQAFPIFAKNTTAGRASEIKSGIKRKVKEEWKDIMAITDVPTPKKIDGTDFGIFADHPQKVIKIAQISGPQKLPKRPKRKLEDLFKEKSGKVKKTKKEMTPEGFHNYFQQHIQDMTKSISRKAFAFQIGDHVSLENAVAQLKNAYKHLCPSSRVTNF